MTVRIEAFAIRTFIVYVILYLYTRTFHDIILVRVIAFCRTIICWFLIYCCQIIQIKTKIAMWKEIKISIIFIMHFRQSNSHSKLRWLKTLKDSFSTWFSKMLYMYFNFRNIYHLRFSPFRILDYFHWKFSQWTCLRLVRKILYSLICTISLVKLHKSLEFHI